MYDTSPGHPILFFPTSGSLNMEDLRVGHTVFVRYAMRCFFSDLATEAIKVEELNFVKVIAMNLDTLLFTASLYFDRQYIFPYFPFPEPNPNAFPFPGPPPFLYDRATVPPAGPMWRHSGEPPPVNAPAHGSFCRLCCELAEVFNLSFDSFIDSSSSSTTYSKLKLFNF
ncbi:hypothetical protein VOLCADRAFT_98871 [Volvox carteri f. nagariensis]|uniref:Uncharacterized protein n=1 Tax=Volvox carteri f. nagariensis TaxID=3068 RepID=D8UGI0_VOLCA|nr:uncharacterized protein VOLCADRAFT_98871 [Volvox carteri f. nagariensis]EFJ41204.1 hypothetical protein VOLCADRAFT_98871 [Volvox carteri f. nagariensis]|eukprot:XP_002957772.1 hypothetical protein VOLCADRAFT_98871 [Volvox carteri f. nagariensis]